METKKENCCCYKKRWDKKEKMILPVTILATLLSIAVIVDIVKVLQVCHLVCTEEQFENALYGDD